MHYRSESSIIKIITEHSGKGMDNFMYAISYLEINSCCFVIMAIIFYRNLQSLDRSLRTKTLLELLISSMVYVICDMICGLQQNGAIALPPAMSAIMNVAFFVSSYSMTHLTFAFTECELGREWVDDFKKRILSLIPAGILTVLTFCTLKWKFFFYIDTDGLYQKGPWYMLMMPFVYCYIIFIAIHVLWMWPQKKYYALRDKLKMVSSFVVFPVLAGVIQIFAPGVSVICFGVTIGVIQAFTGVLETRITIDELTQINNRTKLMQYLEYHFENRGKNPEKDLYFIIMDMNDFKGINDTYGHVEGDEALKQMAGVLKLSMSFYQGILARFGGDEFCIAGEMTELEVKKLQRRIYEDLKISNQQSKKPYEIEMCMGYAKLTSDIKTIPDLMNQADNELYRQKKQKKEKKHSNS